MDSPQLRYYAFLLRIWQVSSIEESPRHCPGEYLLAELQSGNWRVSLENPHTRRVTGFDSLEALAAYLHRLVEVDSGPPAANH